MCLIKLILGLICFDHGVAWKQILVLRQQIIRRRLVKVGRWQREVAVAPSAIRITCRNLEIVPPCLVTLFVLPNSEPQGTLWDDRR